MFIVQTNGTVTARMDKRTPRQIALEITNPIIGAFPDFTDDVRGQVESAIELGIKVDRAQYRSPLLDPEREQERQQNLRMATLNVAAPLIAAQIRAQRSQQG